MQQFTWGLAVLSAGLMGWPMRGGGQKEPLKEQAKPTNERQNAGQELSFLWGRTNGRGAERADQERAEPGQGIIASVEFCIRNWQGVNSYKYTKLVFLQCESKLLSILSRSSAKPSGTLRAAPREIICLHCSANNDQLWVKPIKLFTNFPVSPLFILKYK